MKNNDRDKQAAPAPAEQAPPQVTLRCKVIVNAMLYRDAHHAAGKMMDIPRPEAEYLAGMNPPQVEITGVS